MHVCTAAPTASINVWHKFQSLIQHSHTEESLPKHVQTHVCTLVPAASKNVWCKTHSFIQHQPNLGISAPHPETPNPNQPVARSLAQSIDSAPACANQLRTVWGWVGVAQHCSLHTVPDDPDSDFGQRPLTQVGSSRTWCGCVAHSVRFLAGRRPNTHLASPSAPAQRPSTPSARRTKLKVVLVEVEWRSGAHLHQRQAPTSARAHL
jgi:hypothetical protein